MKSSEEGGDKLEGTKPQSVVSRDAHDTVRTIEQNGENVSTTKKDIEPMIQHEHMNLLKKIIIVATSVGVAFAIGLFIWRLK